MEETTSPLPLLLHSFLVTFERRGADVEEGPRPAVTVTALEMRSEIGGVAKSMRCWGGSASPELTRILLLVAVVPRSRGDLAVGPRPRARGGGGGATTTAVDLAVDR